MRNYSKLRICILCAALMVMGCSGTPAAAPDPSNKPTSFEVKITPSPSVYTQAPLTAMPTKEISPTAVETPIAFSLTPTPRQTYVPLPRSTPEPNPDGTTPTPTPQWATPFPSPTGAPTLSLLDEIELATVINCREHIFVRSSASRSSHTLGRADLGTSYRVIADEGDWIQILFNGSVGYVNSAYIEKKQADCVQTDALSYNLCSLNVHNMGNGSRVDEIARVILNSNADIVCIQEVDLGTRRVKGENCTELLSKALGYPYWVFSHATGYEGGSFGTAIISRYPIIDARTINLEVAVGKEARSLGYARILLDGGAVSVFNTHLCPSPMCLKSINLASLQYELKATGVKVYTVSGDFNCSPPRLDDYLPDIHFVNMDKTTFGDGAVPKILDNILYTDGIIPSDFRIIDTRSTSITDHDMVFCKITVLAP